MNNCVGVDSTDMQVITYPTLQKFLESRQMESKSEEEVKAIVKVLLVLGGLDQRYVVYRVFCF